MRWDKYEVMVIDSHKERTSVAKMMLVWVPYCLFSLVPTSQVRRLATERTFC